VEPEPTEPRAPEPAQLDSDQTVDPLDAAAAALDAPRQPRRSRRTTRSEARERKRAAKAERSRQTAEQRAGEKGRQLPDPAEALVAALPQIKAVYAAIVSGALAGLAAVLLAIGASKGCESVRDTSSCGGGAGLLALVAILAIEVLIGASLLKAWRISDPFSTSFLGIGVVATIAMLTFLDELDSPWMLLVIPLMTAAAFALSWWVTVRFIDEHPMASEIDSERGEPDFDEPSKDDSDHDSNA
jgi:hypothetical protein